MVLRRKGLKLFILRLIYVLPSLRLNKYLLYSANYMTAKLRKSYSEPMLLTMKFQKASNLRKTLNNFNKKRRILRFPFNFIIYF